MLRLPGYTSEPDGLSRVLPLLDFAVHRLILFNIVVQRPQKSARMMRCYDDPVLYARRRNTWHHPDKIQNKFFGGVRNHHQVGINALRRFLVQFYVELIV